MTQYRGVRELAREPEVRVVTGLPDEHSEARGLPPCHVGFEVEYQGDSKIVEVVKFDRIPGWGSIVRELKMWIDREDPWSWHEEPRVEKGIDG